MNGGGDFKRSKQLFADVTMDLKREDKGGISHYLLTETNNLCMNTLILGTRSSFNRRCLLTL